LVQLETALQAVRAEGKLSPRRIGVLVYGDEKFDCRYTADFIRAAAAKAGRVLVLRPSNPTGKLITGRRGLCKYRLTVEGESLRLGQPSKKGRVMVWLYNKLSELCKLTDNKARIGVAALDLKTQGWPLRLPHGASVIIQVNYPRKKALAATEEKLRAILGKPRFRYTLDRLSDRPPMTERADNVALARSLEDAARRWDVPLQTETSVLPSVAGLVPQGVPVLCGLGPASQDLYTVQERISRISLIHRTLMLAELLLAEPKGTIQ
jgi:acetylornithine deacetylase/succinyl-diaminopimelate desuccinylase-like protein